MEPLKLIGTISQTGTSAPEITIGENTIGSLALARIDAGQYTATLEDAFAGKLVVGFCGSSVVDITVNDVFYQVGKIDDDSISIACGNKTDGLQDDLLIDSPLMILLYPSPIL